MNSITHPTEVRGYVILLILTNIAHVHQGMYMACMALDSAMVEMAAAHEQIGQLIFGQRAARSLIFTQSF